MKKYISNIRSFVKGINKQNTKEFMLVHKNALIVMLAIVLLGGIITAASYAYYSTLANQSIVGGQVGTISNINMYVYVEDKNATTGAGLGTYSRSVYIPQYAYTYNSSLSYCKKGSTLTYNSTTHTFSISNSKDACYVYFDASVAANADIVLNVYQLKNGEYKKINGIPNGYELNTTLSSCTNGATMTMNNNKIIVNSQSKTVCDAYLDRAQFSSIYRNPSSPLYLANYGSSAASTYQTSINSLTVNTDYFYQPDSSWDYYLKHDLDNQGRIIESYACFKNNNTEYCLKGGDGGAAFSINRSLLKNTTFNNVNCADSGSYVSCNGQYNTDDIIAYNDGLVKTSDDLLVNSITDRFCYVTANGSSSCAEESLPSTIYPVYWNNNFGNSSSSFTYPNTAGTTYTSLPLFQKTYSYTSHAPVYIKTTSTEHLACLYYNNNEFCYGNDFWDTNAATTAIKMQSAMESALGVSANENCATSGNGWNADDTVVCNFGNNWCMAYNNGNAYGCGGGPSGSQAYCETTVSFGAGCTINPSW